MARNLYEDYGDAYGGLFPEVTHDRPVNPALLVGSAFALGLVTGLVLSGSGRQLFDRARTAIWHRGVEDTVTYPQNLPDSLTRREPASGQPRFGGTGALGVSPAAAGVAPSKEG